MFKLFGALIRKQEDSGLLVAAGVRSAVRKAGGQQGEASYTLLFFLTAAGNSLLSGLSDKKHPTPLPKV